MFSPDRYGSKVLLQILTVFLAVILSSLVPAISFAEPVSKGKARQAAENFLFSQQSLQEEVAPEGKMFHYAKTASVALTIIHTRTIRDDDGKLLAYVHELSPEGFIITSADTEVRAVLGYSFKGKFPFMDAKDNALLHLIKWDVKARLKALEESGQSTKSLTKANTTGWGNYGMETYEGRYTATEAIQEWGPWITTNWNQSGHFNNKVPYTVPYVPGVRRLVGCVATAMSQIMNYWQYPPSIEVDPAMSPEGDGYISEPSNIDIFNDSNAYGFPTVTELNSALATINYDGNTEEEAYLNFAAGIKLGMDYGYGGSSAATGLVPLALTGGFSYGSAEPSGNWNYVKPKVIENIKEGWPVQIAVYESGADTGHSVIIDGYKSTGECHLNMGWGGSDDAWYFLPDVDTTRPNPGPYDVIHTVIYNIAPYKGWSQYGSDEKSSFRTIYSAPVEGKNKWSVTCPTSHHFTGLVVGTGNKIYASVSPRNEGWGDVASIWIIDQYGTKEKEIVLNGVQEGITYPAQSSDGRYIFVGTDSGHIYRIDTRSDTATKIFTEPSGGQFFDPPKIDSDDNIYFSTLNTLYSLTPSGTERWHYTVGPGQLIHRGAPAIDSTRDRVYIPYLDISPTPLADRKTYLASLDRNNGALVAERVWPHSQYSIRSPGSPSIGPDGTVYIGNRSVLYALSPYSIDGTPLWSRDFILPALANNTPVIGKDNTIYVTYWSEVAGNYYMHLSALDGNNLGSQKWIETFTPSGLNDNILQPYVASNGVVVFTYLLENGANPDIFGILAYKDNGNTGQLLWSKSYGESGGQVAFGPGSTVYVVPSSGYGHTIFAVTEGAAGDPHGAAMDFANNQPPNTPSSPSPLNGAVEQPTNLTLSWSASDPDGHSLTYDLLISALVEEEDVSFVPEATQLTTASYTVSGLIPGVQYLWKVIVTDGQSIAVSPTWSFSTVGEAPPKEDLVVDFGPAYGTYVRYNDSTWTKLHTLSPNHIATGDLDGSGGDEVIMDFPGYGTFVYDGAWTKLHSLSPELMATGDLDGSGGDEVIMGFPGYGTFVYYNNSTWTKLHGLVPDIIATGDLDGIGVVDEVVMGFAGYGTFVYYNGTWQKLHNLSPELIATGDLDGIGGDEVIMGFPGYGTFVYNNGTWTKLHHLSPDVMATGDLDGSGQDDAVLGFTGYGTFVYYNNSTWVKLHNLSPEVMATADMDGSGLDEVVMGFLGYGTYVYYNDSTWTKLHSLSPDNDAGIAAGNIDGN